MSGKKLYLNDFTKEVTKDGDLYKVTYVNGEFKGECLYMERPPLSRLQSETIYLLMSADMGDVIEYIHKKSPLSSEDFNEVDMMIMEDSFQFIKAQGPHVKWYYV